MKLSFKHLLSAALLMAMPLTFTSCEGALDDIFGEWSRPGSEDPYVLSAALKEGALVSYTIIENGVEKVITFKRVGNEYVLITPASTRKHDQGEASRYWMDFEPGSGGSGGSGGTSDGGSSGGDTGVDAGGGGSLVLHVNAEDGTPALVAVTQIADASTQVAKYKDNYEVQKITWEGEKKAPEGKLVLPAKHKAILIWGDPDAPNYKMELPISILGLTRWINLASSRYFNFTTAAGSELVLIIPIKNESGVVENLKFYISNDENEEIDYSTHNWVYIADVVEDRTYFLVPLENE